MKSFVKTLFVFIMVSITAVFASFPAFADSKLTINGDAKAKKGDTITYEMFLGDCKDKLEGLQMYLFYDSKYLQADSDSLDFPSLSGVVSNANLDDCIAFNWSSVTDLVSFKKNKGLVSVDFTVLKGGKTDITYFVSEMYGDDMTYFKSYTITYSLSVNGKKAVESKVPIVNSDEDINNKYQGNFINYADGKGEENGSGNNHIAITGIPTTMNLNNSPVTDVEKGGNNNIVTILTIIGIVLVIIAIIIVVILRNHYTKKYDNVDDNLNTDTSVDDLNSSAASEYAEDNNHENS